MAQIVIKPNRKEPVTQEYIDVLNRIDKIDDALKGLWRVDEYVRTIESSLKDGMVDTSVTDTMANLVWKASMELSSFRNRIMLDNHKEFETADANEYEDFRKGQGHWAFG